MFRQLSITLARYRYLILLLVPILALILGGATIFYIVESSHISSFMDALWWVIITMTTVGYGDIVPNTFVGRLVGFVVILLGVVLVSMFTATVASVFVTKKLKEEKGLRQITDQDHLVLCGWNPLAEQFLDEVFRFDPGRTVVLVNQLPEEQIHNVLTMYRDQPLKYVRGDFVNEMILERANVARARAVVIIPDASSGMAPRSDEKTILAAFTIRAMNPRAKLFVHILDRESEAYIKKAQVDDYIVSDAYSGVLLGRMIMEPGVPQVIRELLNPHSPYTFHRIPIPGELVGKTFGDAIAYFRKKGQLPIGLVMEKEPFSLKTILSEDYSYLDEFIENKFRQAGRSLKKGKQVDVRMNPPDDTPLYEGQYLVVLQ
ncbi:MAG: potassium channel protein [Calditrichaeota bacterium]|nr:potassium channel protein [Calditrichota bacterium]